MDIVHPRVAGLDVHKKVVWVAVRLPGSRPGERTVTVKRYRTFWRELKKMAAWLTGLGVTDVALESTGVYWWPVYHALAQAGIEVCVCNAAHMRNVPGRKRDVADCQWIAELHEHGLLRPGFIPDAQVAALRQRTRYRKLCRCRHRCRYAEARIMPIPGLVARPMVVAGVETSA
jgi:transposase